MVKTYTSYKELGPVNYITFTSEADDADRKKVLIEDIAPVQWHLIQHGYDVLLQEEDPGIFILSFTRADDCCGGLQFYAVDDGYDILSEEELSEICNESYEDGHENGIHEAKLKNFEIKTCANCDCGQDPIAFCDHWQECIKWGVDYDATESEYRFWNNSKYAEKIEQEAKALDEMYDKGYDDGFDCGKLMKEWEEAGDERYQVFYEGQPFGELIINDSDGYHPCCDDCSYCDSSLEDWPCRECENHDMFIHFDIYDIEEDDE